MAAETNNLPRPLLPKKVQLNMKRTLNRILRLLKRKQNYKLKSKGQVLRDLARIKAMMTRTSRETKIRMIRKRLMNLKTIE
jgi:hypothetical protein